MTPFVIKMDMAWLTTATPLEQACYTMLENLVKANTQNVSLYWAKKDLKQFYTDHKDLVVNREREINTYSWFMTELGNAYALTGSMTYADILCVYCQAIYFGTLGI